MSNDNCGLFYCCTAYSAGRLAVKDYRRLQRPADAFLAARRQVMCSAMCSLCEG
jgi:hypothetical protein